MTHHVGATAFVAQPYLFYKAYVLRLSEIHGVGKVDWSM